MSEETEEIIMTDRVSESEDHKLIFENELIRQYADGKGNIFQYNRPQEGGKFYAFVTNKNEMRQIGTWQKRNGEMVCIRCDLPVEKKSSFQSIADASL